MRRPLIAGNWKMYKTLPEAEALAMELKGLLSGSTHADMLVAPPFTALAAVAQKLKGTGIAVAGQTLHPNNEGAFTGEISGPMLRAAGCSHVIIGHSERRQIFKETDADANARVRAALTAGLIPVLCVGETLAEREAQSTFDVLARQVSQGLANISNEQASQVVIAYEPVWAIGTGRNATPEQAQEAHAFIRARLGTMFKVFVPANMRILYGGSVKPDNVDGIMAQADVDGVLVGGASLKAKDFARIVGFQPVAGAAR